MKRLLLVVALILISVPLVFALPGVTPKKAVWDPNTEEDLDGYYLYWGDQGAFNDNDRVDVGNVNEFNLDAVPGPEIAITAYDTSRNESDFSNVVPLDNIAPSSNSTLRTEKQ